ncbi:MAG TPA: YfcE family phosphodiesterase [Patescibacteria group bacterium]|nr:YfcE family phosphodiesterase [Patescibacteria group bacterium]
MLIAIISDIHNNTVNLKKVLDYCLDVKIENIICCGDLASKETLDFLNDNFSGHIYYTFGNMDNDQLLSFSPEEIKEEYRKTTIFKDFGEVKIDGINIAFVHYPDKAEKLCQRGKFKFVFYGHTHKPWEQDINGCKMLNPGNVAGEIYLPTFAVWNTENDKFQLIRIHDLK